MNITDIPHINSRTQNFVAFWGRENYARMHIYDCYSHSFFLSFMGKKCQMFWTLKISKNYLRNAIKFSLNDTKANTLEINQLSKNYHLIVQPSKTAWLTATSWAYAACALQTRAVANVSLRWLCRDFGTEDMYIVIDVPANTGCYHGYLRIIHADATDTLDSAMFVISKTWRCDTNKKRQNRPPRTKSRHEIYTLLILVSDESQQLSLYKRLLK